MIIETFVGKVKESALIQKKHFKKNHNIHPTSEFEFFLKTYKLTTALKLKKKKYNGTL